MPPLLSIQERDGVLQISIWNTMKRLKYDPPLQQKSGKYFAGAEQFSEYRKGNAQN